MNSQNLRFLIRYKSSLDLALVSIEFLILWIKPSCQRPLRRLQKYPEQDVDNRLVKAKIDLLRNFE